MSNIRNDFKERLALVLPELTFIKEDGRYAYVLDKYGILKVRKDTLLKGSIPKINSAVDKIGISRRVLRGNYKEILRYKDYNKYDITPVIEIDFDNSGDSKILEQRIKEIIKDFQYNPTGWNNSTSRECFTEEKLNEVKLLILDYIKNCNRIQINGCNGLCKSDVASKSSNSGCGCSK